MWGDFDELPGGELDRPPGISDRTWLEMQTGRIQSERTKNKATVDRLCREKKIGYVGNGYVVGNVRIPVERDAVGNPSDANIATICLVAKSQGIDVTPEPRQQPPAQKMLRSGKND